MKLGRQVAEKGKAIPNLDINKNIEDIKKLGRSGNRGYKNEYKREEFLMVVQSIIRNWRK